MGIRTSTAYLLVLLIALSACGRRGKPSALRDATELPPSVIVTARIGDVMGIRLTEPSDDFRYQTLDAPSYHCPTDDEPSGEGELIYGPWTDWLRFPLPTTMHAFGRIVDESGLRASPWSYAPPVTESPAKPKVRHKLTSDGRVILTIPKSPNIMLEEFREGQWLYRGPHKSGEITYGPYAPGKRTGYRIWGAKEVHEGLIFSQQPQIIGPIDIP